jgi:hypothetical protein
MSVENITPITPVIEEPVKTEPKTSETETPVKTELTETSSLEEKKGLYAKKISEEVKKENELTIGNDTVFSEGKINTDALQNPETKANVAELIASGNVLNRQNGAEIVEGLFQTGEISDENILKMLKSISSTAKVNNPSRFPSFSIDFISKLKNKGGDIANQVEYLRKNSNEQAADANIWSRNPGYNTDKTNLSRIAKGVLLMKGTDPKLSDPINGQTLKKEFIPRLQELKQKLGSEKDRILQAEFIADASVVKLMMNAGLMTNVEAKGILTKLIAEPTPALKNNLNSFRESFLKSAISNEIITADEAAEYAAQLTGAK